MENQRRNPDDSQEVNEEVPIDSSYIYLPIHSGTTFHEILKDAIGNDRNNLLGETEIKRLKEEMRQINEVMKVESRVIKGII